MKQIKPNKPDIRPASNLNRSVPRTSNNTKPLASVSLDLDNLWSYMKTHGDSGWDTFPSYLNLFVPIVLDELDDLNLKITFFIVGQDAALDKNRDVLGLITARGHEVGNHSFNHDVWLGQYSKDLLKREILEAEVAIQRASGQKPQGFRGPGFCYNNDLLEVLNENNYLFDASMLPSSIGPLARFYYFFWSDFSREEKEKRKHLYGRLNDALMPVKPHQIKLSNGSFLLEIPVTTIPMLKLPFHLSYLLYLSRFSLLLMDFYLALAIQLCRITKTEPSFLLHPLDLLNGQQVPELHFFPGMNLPANKKRNIFIRVLKVLSRHFKLVNMTTHARSALSSF